MLAALQVTCSRSNLNLLASNHIPRSKFPKYLQKTPIISQNQTSNKITQIQIQTPALNSGLRIDDFSNLMKWGAQLRVHALRRGSLASALAAALGLPAGAHGVALQLATPGDGEQESTWEKDWEEKQEEEEEQ